MTLKFFSFNPTGKQIKLLLVILASIIVSMVLMYTQIMVRELQVREDSAISYYADILRYIAQSENENIDLIFLDRFTPTITFPVINTDPNDEPLAPFQENTLNIKFDAAKPQKKQHEDLVKLIAKMRENYAPIVIKDSHGQVIQKIFYANSDLVKRLTWLPVVEIVAVSLFIFMGYVGFNYLKRIEQSHLWVGLAKEAAHQLGTPLSSMLAWTEIVKMNINDPRQVLDVMEEMQHDIDRLNKIAQRFSKIGSKPERKNENLGKLIENVAKYFEHRLPHLGKRVEIIRELSPNVCFDVNADLFEWVIENLLKNGAESIETKNGLIQISLVDLKDKIQILVRDNGKGMTPAVRRDAFRPGFSTKKRGWGLGLSLCKRIIEEYHGGKIIIKESGLGKGTVFSIELIKPLPN